MRWIKAGDLNNWSSTRDCQENLPLLLRQLIRATAPNIKKIRFSAGDAISTPGWDGILDVEEGTEYIPKGHSRWEFGCNKTIKAKADEDYEKRKHDPLGENPAEITYVFVTPRIWNQKDSWCQERRKENFWKDILVYDARELEEWLEQAPAVAAEFAVLLNIIPNGVISLKDWWNKWKKIPTLEFTSELILAGRNIQEELIQNWLKKSPTEINVEAFTIEESIVFLAAVISKLPENGSQDFFARTLIIEDTYSFNKIIESEKQSLFLILSFREINNASLATQKGHHVYIPSTPENTINTANANPNYILLPRLGREDFVIAIKEMGIPEEEAQKYAIETGRSLSVLRRQLTNAKEQPEWAKPENARQLIPLLLAGSWDASKDGDKEIIAKLSNGSYDAYANQLFSWLRKADSPVLNIGMIWKLVSHIDAWYALAPFLTPSDINKFKQIALTIFKSIDPALDLKPENRFAATVYGKGLLYSKTLRKNIAKTLIFIAIFGEDVKLPISGTSQSWVDQIVNELLINADEKLWYSLSDIMPLIAEASPSSFLNAVECSLRQEKPAIMGMFSETKDSFTSSSAHPGLLWALESLAWSSQYISRVILILSSLTKLDPGGRIVSRPFNSLRNIFVVWRPQTYATIEERIEALNLLLERDSDVSWSLMLSLMPNNHETLIPSHKTTWRQFSEKYETNIISTEEYWKEIKTIIKRLLTQVGYDSKRWVGIFNEISLLIPEDDRKQIIKQLASNAKHILNNHLEIWNKLRELLSKHRTCSGANWAIPENELIELEKIYKLFEPQNLIDKFCWLFDDYWPDLPEGDKLNKQTIEQTRFEAIKEIYEKQNLDGIIKMAEQVKNPQFIGEIITKLNIKPEEENKIFSCLESDCDKKQILVRSYLLGLYQLNGEEWAKTIIDSACKQQWQEGKIQKLLIIFPPKQFICNLLQTFGENIQINYWKNCNLNRFYLELPDSINAIKQLLKVKRFITALDLTASYKTGIPAELIEEILIRTATEKSEEKVSSGYLDIESLFEALDQDQNFDRNRLLKLEWFYLKHLINTQRTPKILFNELTNNPNFFAEIIKYMYKPKNSEIEESVSEELLKQRANLAWELIYHWSDVPGSDENGKINNLKLKNWTIMARKLCEESDRKEVGDITIGEALGHAKLNEENWPPEEICQIIEEMQNDEIDRGFKIGIYRQRGTISRGFFEGGQQEKELVKIFSDHASILAIKYPRIAQIMRDIANYYECDAKREDNSAEIRSLEY